MGLLDDIISRYAGNGTAAATQDTEQDFNHVAQNAPGSLLSKGLSAIFGSSQTASPGELVSQMFGNSSPQQRADMLNHLGSSLGPTAASVLGGLFGTQASAATTGAPPTVTPEQASQVDPAQVQVAVNNAQEHNPEIVDKLSDFNSQHPQLVKTLGSAALAIGLAKMSQHMRA